MAFLRFSGITDDLVGPTRIFINSDSIQQYERISFPEEDYRNQAKTQLLLVNGTRILVRQTRDEIEVGLGTAGIPVVNL